MNIKLNTCKLKKKSFEKWGLNSYWQNKVNRIQKTLKIPFLLNSILV